MPTVVAAAALAAIPALGATGAAIVGHLVVTAVAYGIGEYLRATHGRPRDVARNAFGDDGRKQSIRQAVPVKRAVYGQVLAAGPMFFYHVANPWLYVGQLLSEGPIAGVDSVQIAGRTVHFSPATLAPVEEPYQTSSGIFAYASFRNGSSSQAIDPLLAADFPALPSTFRQRGIATVVYKLHWGTNSDHHNLLWGASPNPLALMRGRLVYDPRVSGQDPANPATWVYSSNAALILAHWLINRWRHPVPAALVDWDRIKQAADICDEWVPRLNADPERRFEAHGIVMGDDAHFETARQLLSALNGGLTYRNGLYSIRAAAPRTPVATITDADIVGPIRQRHAAPIRESPNTIRTVFHSSERGWERANGPILAPVAYLAADGRPNTVTLDLPWTVSHTTAQRLAKQAMEERRLGRTLSTSLHHVMIGLEVGDVVRVSLRTLPYLDGLYTVEQLGVGARGLPVELRAYADTTFAWDAATEEQPFTIDPVDLAA